MLCTCCDCEIAVGEAYYDIEGEQMCQGCFDFWVEEHTHFNEPDYDDEEVI